MKHKIIPLALGTVLALIAVGCGTAPTLTPAPTQPPQIITVVVTATSLPVTAAPPPSPALTPTVDITATAPVTFTTTAFQPTKPAVATKPATAGKPSVVAATPTITALPLKFGAPTLVRPLFEPASNPAQKNEVRFDSDDIDFRWRPFDGFGSDECYLLKLTSQATNPVTAPGSKSDSFVVRCGNQPRTDDEIRLGEIRFTLNSPRKGVGPSYDSIKLATTNEMWVFWTITVVKNLGQCPADNPFQCKTVPLSPPSDTGKFLFKATN